MRSFTGYNKPNKGVDYKHQKPFEHPELDNDGKWFNNQSTGLKTLFAKNLDWRAIGGVPPVRDQASCGSCWAFGTASVIEARLNAMHNSKHYKKHFLMSEQSIIDCIWQFNEPALKGCNGGYADMTMERIIEDYNGVLPYLEDNPYYSQPRKCNETAFTKGFGKHKLNSFSKTAPNSIGELKYALLNGPVTVAIAVTEKMVFYAGGVFNDPLCSNKHEDLGHQVVVTGWGFDESSQQEYWIVRNSWSNAWGIDGYIYIATKNNLCGVTLETTIPNFADKSE